MPHWKQTQELLQALYLKEVDQEENVWRSLPFFSATLAVEVIALNQVAPRANLIEGPVWWLSLGSAAILVLLIVAVIVYLYRAIQPRTFSYVSEASAIVAYVETLERTPQPEPIPPEYAPDAQLRRMLVNQLAAAIDANQRINQDRAQERGRAAVLLLASILMTIVVIGVTFLPSLGLSQ